MPNGPGAAVGPARTRHPVRGGWRTEQGALLGAELLLPARRLILNHPLNYMVVPYLRMYELGSPIMSLLSKYWGHRLKAEGSQRHAINGAYALGLIDAHGELTPDGIAVVEVMRGIGFNPSSAPDPHARLADVSPSLAAIARLVLGHQQTVELVHDALRACPKSACMLPELIYRARLAAPGLTDELFIVRHPVRLDDLGGTDVVNSTVYQFKQVLWHAGILRTKAHHTAGKRADVYVPHDDLWGLDMSILSVST